MDIRCLPFHALIRCFNINKRYVPMQVTDATNLKDIIIPGSPASPPVLYLHPQRLLGFAD